MSRPRLRRPRLVRLSEALAGPLGRLADLVLLVSAAGLVLMTGVVGWQIFGRYVLNDTPHWSETLAVYLLFYYTLPAAAVGVRQGTHIGLTMLRDRLPRRSRLLAEAAAQLLLIGFGLAMIWYGARIAISTWEQTIPTLGLPSGSRYLPFPLSGLLIVLFAAEGLLRTLAGEEAREEWS